MTYPGLVVNPETGQIVGPPGSGGGGPPSRAPSPPPSPAGQAPSGGKGPDTTVADWPDKTGPFTRNEWQDAGLKTPPKDWEMRGYGGWYVKTPDGRKVILEDIQRARVSTRGVSTSDLATAPGQQVPEGLEKLKDKPRKEPWELDFTVRRSKEGQRKYLARVTATRKQHLDDAMDKREAERGAGGTVHSIDYHLRRAQLPEKVKAVAEVTEAAEEFKEKKSQEQLAAEARGREFVEQAKLKRKLQLKPGAPAEMPQFKLTGIPKIEKVATQTPDGYWIGNEKLRQIKNTSPELHDVLTKQGYKVYLATIGADRAIFESNLAKSNPDLYKLYRKQGGAAYDVVVTELDKAKPNADILANYLSEKDKSAYNESSARDKFSILQASGIVPITLRYTGERQGKPRITPSTGLEHRVMTAGGGEVLAIGAEILVPGVYVARHWKELSAAEKAIFLTLDVASFALPAAGAVVRGSRAGATFGRLAMARGALRGLGTEALAQLKAPVTLLLHPIATAKSTAGEIRTLAENIGNIKKIPEAVITTTHGTVRLRITKNLTPAEAFAITDELMVKVARGEKPIIEMAGYRVELARSPLMRETGGGLIHTTPQGEAFEHGLKVTAKPGASASERGLFLANEPLPRFTEASAFGKTGDKSAFVIVSREMAEHSVPTEKIFSGTVEMERKLKIGTELPEPIQKLYTRIGVNGHRVEIWLYEPLSARQIVKLKAEGLIEAIKAPFKPAIKIKGKGKLVGLTDTEVSELAKVLRASGNTDQARSLLRAREVARTMRVSPPVLADVLGRVDRTAVERARAAIRTVTPSVSRFGELDDLREVKPLTRTEARTLMKRGVGERGATVTDSAGVIRPIEPSIDTLRAVAPPEVPLTPERIITPPEEPIMPPRVVPPPVEPGEPVRPPIIPDEPSRPPRVPGIPERPPKVPDIPKEPPPTPKLPTPELISTTILTSDEKKNAVSWPQGFGWWVVYQGEDEQLYRFFNMGQEAPQGIKQVEAGEGEAYRGVQRFRGKGKTRFNMPMGVVDVGVDNPLPLPGKRGAIKFSRSAVRITQRRPRLP